MLQIVGEGAYRARGFSQLIKRFIQMDRQRRIRIERRLKVDQGGPGLRERRLTSCEFFCRLDY